MRGNVSWIPQAGLRYAQERGRKGVNQYPILFYRFSQRTLTKTELQDKMIKINVKDTNGTERSISFEENPSGNLMEILTEESFDVPAICGGMAGCGTCHVNFLAGADKLEEMEEDEEFMLDSLPNTTETSRLSCQLRTTSALDGASIEVLGDG